MKESTQLLLLMCAYTIPIVIALALRINKNIKKQRKV